MGGIYLEKRGETNPDSGAVVSLTQFLFFSLYSLDVRLESLPGDNAKIREQGHCVRFLWPVS